MNLVRQAFRFYKFQSAEIIRLKTPSENQVAFYLQLFKSQPQWFAGETIRLLLAVLPELPSGFIHAN